MSNFSWNSDYNATMMTASETTRLDNLFGRIFYGGLGGMGQATEAFITYGISWHGPVVWEHQGEIPETDKIKEIVERKLEELMEKISSWKPVHKGDGSTSFLTKVIGDFRWVISMKSKSSSFGMFCTDVETEWFWGDAFMIYWSDNLKKTSLETVIEEFESRARPLRENGRKGSFV